MDGIQIIERLLPQMSEVMNVIPGEEFRMNDSDTLLILQRRMEKSDLCMELQTFNEIFSEKDGCSLHKIRMSAVALIKIRLLIEHKEADFNPRSLRALIKEFHVQSAKVENIIHLSSVNAMAASDYQKEKIELILKKNHAFLDAFQIEIDSLEKKIERMPVSEEEPKEEIKPKEKEKEAPVSVKQERKNPLEAFTKRFQDAKEKKVIDEQLKQVEKEESLTSCGEIPFYERSLVFTEKYECKDIPAYCIFKRKNNFYFGLTRNVNKSAYDNEDNSLMELTEATDDFLQFMTVDLLSDEYELVTFSAKEKEALRMYFNFVSGCFQKFIGVTLTVQEYLAFKKYYNKLVLRMFELEKKQKEVYYKALILADSYLAYMEGYDLKCSDDEETIIANIVKEKYGNYIDDLNLIMDNHICDEDARTDLTELICKIKGFNKPMERAEVKKEPQTEVLPPNQQYDLFPVMPQMYGMPMMPMNINQGVMQIVIQILNRDLEVVDEALYSGNNINQALYDYQSKGGYIKRLGFRNNGQDIFCKEEKEMILSEEGSEINDSRNSSYHISDCSNVYSKESEENRGERTR